MKSIIKHGEIPKAIGECPYCGCKFKYDRREVYDDGIEGITSRFMVDCPCCEMKLLVSEESKIALKLNEFDL